LIADAAGALLLEIREDLDAGIDPASLRNEGDRRSHELILQLLAEYGREDAVLSEEARDDLRRLDASRQWIVDPLDGTREFAEDGRIDWAVHVALVEQGNLVAGAVALPAQRRTYCTGTVERVGARPSRAIRIAVSRTRPAAEALLLAERLGGELVPMGSAGAKAMAVISGEVDLYIHSGGQYAWDSAAPVAVARVAGLHTSRIDGSPLVYGLAETWLPDLLICHQADTQLVLGALAG
jgi:3'(2'), 5'-bisphosphate nucleotidase